ncbi:MAG: sigma-54 dependent transcriptional regulator [Proteobacteria bacterium]|nr:sigma-54 dependent transcriptional regulator [Pseudomonadota bacterium]
MARILIIDDEIEICRMLTALVKDLGHDATCANTVKDGLKAAQASPFDLVFLDVMMPDGSGLDILPKIKETPSDPEVIIMTGYGNPDGAELAIKNGAWDYVQKPPSIKELTLSLQRALQYREEIKDTPSPKVLDIDEIVGRSPRMKTCLQRLAQAASSDTNALITGETGTGKELFARAIHKNSPRAAKSFVVVDCTTLTETLIESILFGHEKGAFTGAEKSYSGLIKQADGGTLFLDEVGELSPSLQKSFLRVLQERSFRPLGGSKVIQSDFRLVSATNRDLDAMTKAGRFRQDLMFRLKSLSIELPPLRKRHDDIREIVMHYLRKFSDRNQSGIKGFSTEFLESLTRYEWPGNVRELVNTMERVFVSANNDQTLFPRHLPTHIRIKLARASVVDMSQEKGTAKSDVNTLSPLPSFREFRQQSIVEMERQYLQDLISLANGTIEECCRISGLRRSRLYGLLKDHQISRNT